MEIMEIIKERKSVRKYLDKPIEKEKLDKVLEAGRLAPSARNQQEWKFVVVTDEELRLQMVEACVNQKFVAEAPALLVICATSERNMRCGQPARTIDCSIALSFMMLQAVELGLGTCWLGDFYADKVKNILNIPEGHSVVAVTPIGYPADVNQKATPRKSQEEVVIYNQWK